MYVNPDVLLTLVKTCVLPVWMIIIVIVCGGSGRSLTGLGCELEARIETRNRRMNLGVVFCNF